NHADDDRVITADILRQNPEKIAERSSGEVSPLNRSRFHTVCKKNAPRSSITARRMIRQTSSRRG
ncbi:MAG: hypothetical protein ACR2KT_04415, partial [Methylocella sp.]